MFNPEVVPKTFFFFFFFKKKVGVEVLGKIKFYVLTFVDYRLFQINKF